MALSSDRDCSQVLFLGILSPHVEFDHVKVATWAGETELDSGLRLEHN